MNDYLRVALFIFANILPNILHFLYISENGNKLL